MITSREINYTVRDVEYDPSSGESRVTIDSEYGSVTGRAFLNKKDDSDYESQYLGCSIAEGRGIIKVIKRHLHTLRKQKQIMEIYYDTISQKKTFNKKINEACHARRYLSHFDNEIKFWSDKIKNIQNNINLQVDEHIKGVEELNRLKKKIAAKKVDK